ncbi:MAG TPA: hypothetical protein VI195_01620 [Steroidobacteraceae bacterium]
MLLRCGKEESGTDEDATPGGCWLRASTLDSLTELNELGLALLAEQSTVRSGVSSALLQPLAELWRALDGAGRRRAAACPYLLLDAGFGDAARWRTPPAAPQVGDGAIDRYAGYFSVPAATELARLVFIFAWHLSRSQPAAARLLLGMPAASVTLVSRYTLRQIEALAESHPEWLRPRWPTRVQVWRELLLAAAAGETVHLERARLRGLTLLAAEARLASARQAAADAGTLAPLAAHAGDHAGAPGRARLAGS